jgi:hypothetical protein
MRDRQDGWVSTDRLMSLHLVLCTFTFTFDKAFHLMSISGLDHFQAFLLL